MGEGFSRFPGRLPPGKRPGTFNSMNLKLPFTSAVAGVSFHIDAVSRVRVGMRVRIEHDSANPYDANACAVYVQDELIGHLPRQLAQRLRARGEDRWKGVVSEVLTGEKATGVRIRVLAGDPRQRETPTQVRARSGRVLGTLIEERDGTVAVRTADGGRVEYPVELVAPTQN